MLTQPGRRAVHVAAAMALTLLALTGCGVGKATGADRLSTDPVTLRINWWGGDERQKLTAEAIRLFEKKYPRIRVQSEYSDWTGYWDRLATMTAGGNPPDVIQMDQLYLSSYADRGALLDLEKSKFLDRDRLSGNILDTGRYKGTLYALPNSVSVSGIAVNTTVLDELGLRLPDTETWTWRQYEAFAAEVTRASHGKVVGTTPMAGQGALELFARQHGDQLFDSKGRLALEPETLAAFWRESERLINAKATLGRSQLADAVALPLDQSPLATGKAAMTMIFATQLSAFAAASGGDDFILVDLPVVNGAVRDSQYLKSAMYWSLSAQTQHPAEAALLVNFLTGDKQAAKLLGAERGLPAVPETRDAIAGALKDEDQAAAAFVESIEKGPLEPPPGITPNGASDVETTLARYGQEVMFGQRKADEAARAFLKETSEKIYSAG